MREKIIIGTRSSSLALWQANYVAARLRRQYPEMQVELRHITTTGDKILDVPLAKIGGKGLFTKELENEMLAGTIDLAVHSLKDMPTILPEGLALAAITQRFDAKDALVSPAYKTLDNLPQGARIGTSSLRRKAQLLHYRPDLTICDLRGNVQTRLDKLERDNLDGIVLAVAGLKRLELGDRITEEISRDICLPAVGQGALAIECCQEDKQLRHLLSFLNDEDTVNTAVAERAFLRQVEGGCQVPVGVYAEACGDEILVKAVIASVDGKTLLKDEIKGDAAKAELLGVKLANRMLDSGGRDIMVAVGCMEASE